MTAAAAPNDERTLLWLLELLTVVSGIVDAVSYLGLGHVFVANMTGNVVFLGFAAVGVGGFSVAGSILALAAFLAGSLAGGWLSRRARPLPALRNGAVVKLALLALATAVAFAFGLGPATYVLIPLLAVTMGLQSALARAAGVDVTTTVLTMTLMSLASDPHIRGRQPHTGRRLVAVAAMFLGAVLGALLFRVTPAAALALATACMAVAFVGAHLAVRP